MLILLGGCQLTEREQYLVNTNRMHDLTVETLHQSIFPALQPADKLNLQKEDNAPQYNWVNRK